MPNPVFGVDYYPEHWPEERWPIDARLMREAGVTTVRLAEFAWSRLEPSEGSFDLAWLDRAIAILAAEGIQIILGTPTAAPPAWLIAAHPEILPVNEAGERAHFGMRRHYCPSQPTFHEATRRIVTAMAEHYADHPAVFAWQTDNELGNIQNGNRCHCEACRAAFADWLRARYGCLEELNRRWGTVFWSQEYTDWDQIPTPIEHDPRGRGGSTHNPSLYLDFARFTSDNWVRYQEIHLRILRELCPTHLVTHNLMGLFPYVDAAELVRDLDIVSWDNYPRLPAPWSPLEGDWSPTRVAQSHDLMRGVKGRTFWVMEEQSGPSGWGMLSPTPLPGEIRLWSLQAAARGAEGIVYFRWRTCRVGTEQYWHGILPHEGTPGRRYTEVSTVGRELAGLCDLLTAPVPAEAAILRSYDALWAFAAQPLTPRFSYDDQIDRHYRALWRHQVTADLITETRPLDAYRLLIAPCLFVVSDELPERLQRWVEAGGTLVLSFRSGVKDVSNRVVDAPLPGPFAEMAGVTVSDYTTLLPAGHGAPGAGPDLIAFDDGAAVGADIWMDQLAAPDAEVLARYSSGPYAGSPAISVRRVGGGNVVYVGASLDDAGHDALLARLLRLADMRPGPAMPEGVEAIRRPHEGTDHWFILNHTGEPREVRLPADGTDLLSGRSIAGTVTIGPLDVVVLRVR